VAPMAATTAARRSGGAIVGPNCGLWRSIPRRRRSFSLAPSLHQSSQRRYKLVPAPMLEVSLVPLLDLCRCPLDWPPADRAEVVGSGESNIPFKRGRTKQKYNGGLLSPPVGEGVEWGK